MKRSAATLNEVIQWTRTLYRQTPPGAYKPSLRSSPNFRRKRGAPGPRLQRALPNEVIQHPPTPYSKPSPATRTPPRRRGRPAPLPDGRGRPRVRAARSVKRALLPSLPRPPRGAGLRAAGRRARLGAVRRGPVALGQRRVHRPGRRSGAAGPAARLRRGELRALRGGGPAARDRRAGRGPGAHGRGGLGLYPRRSGLPWTARRRGTSRCRAASRASSWRSTPTRRCGSRRGPRCGSSRATGGERWTSRSTRVPTAAGTRRRLETDATMWMLSAGRREQPAATRVSARGRSSWRGCWARAPGAS